MNSDPFAADGIAQVPSGDDTSPDEGFALPPADNGGATSNAEELDEIFDVGRQLFWVRIPVFPVDDALAEDGLDRLVEGVRAAGIVLGSGQATPLRIWTTDARFIRLVLSASGDDWQLIDHQAASARRLEHATAEEIARQVRMTEAPCLVELRAENHAEPIAAALRSELTGWPHPVVIAIVAEGTKVTAETKRIEIGILQSIIDGSEGIPGRSAESFPFHIQASQRRWDAGATGGLDARGILEMLLTDLPAYEEEYSRLIAEPSSAHPTLAAGQALAREALGEPSGLLLPVAFLLSQIDQIPHQTFLRLCDGFARKRAPVEGPSATVDHLITDKLGVKRRSDDKGAFVHIVLASRREGMSAMFLEGGFVAASRLFDEIETLLCEIGIEPGFEYEAGRFFGAARVVSGQRSHADLAIGLGRCLQSLIKGRLNASPQEITFATQTLLNGFQKALSVQEWDEGSSLRKLHRIVAALRFDGAGSQEELDQLIEATGAALARVTLAHDAAADELASLEGVWESICLRSFVETVADDLAGDPVRVLQFALAFIRKAQSRKNHLQLVTGLLLLQGAATDYWRLVIGEPGQSSQDALRRTIDISFADLMGILSIQSYFEQPHTLIHGWLKATAPAAGDRLLALRYNVTVPDVRRARLVSRQVLSVPGLLLAGQYPKLVEATMRYWARSHGAPAAGFNISYFSTWLKQFRPGPVAEALHRAIEPFGRLHRGLILAMLFDLSGRSDGGAVNFKVLFSENRNPESNEALRRAVDDLSCLLQVVTELYDIARANPDLGRNEAEQLVMLNRGFRDRLLQLMKQAF